MEKQIVYIKSLNKIIDFFEDLASHKSVMEIKQWKDEKVTINKISLINVNPNNLEIVVRPSDQDHPLHFNPSYPILIQNLNKNIGIKAEIRGVVRDNLMFIKIPKEVLIENIRKFIRYNHEERNVSITYSNFTAVSYTNKYMGLQATLIDISESGLAMKVYDEDNDIFDEYKIGDKLIFSLINDLSLASKIAGRIIYIKKVNKYNSKKYIRIAVQFDRSIPLDKINENILKLESKE